VRYFCSSYPERDELKSIYSIYMSSILGLCVPKHQMWKSSTKVADLTGSMIKIYEEVFANTFMLNMSSPISQENNSFCGCFIVHNQTLVLPVNLNR
jgi:hypothetical protein